MGERVVEVTEWRVGTGSVGAAALFRSVGAVAARAGVRRDRCGFGVVVREYDIDGCANLYKTNFGKNGLFHNNHDGTFTDVADRAGVMLGNWSTGATWGGYDGDGRLDLFVP